MDEKQFMDLLDKLKATDTRRYYRIELFYKGTNIGCIYGGTLLGESKLDEINVDDRGSYLLVYTNTFALLVDNAELRSI